MRFPLFWIDLLVWIFYISKGFPGAKIKAELDIIKNKDKIKKKYDELEKMKQIFDEELIQNFPDEIFVPTNVSHNLMNNTFNSIITKLSKKIKKTIK